MSHPDVKLDREILAKIHNQLKQQSDRMESLEQLVFLVKNELIKHVELCEEQAQGFISQINMLTDLINGEGVITDVGIYSDKESGEDK